MIQKIFEAAMLGNISDFEELLTKELNRRIHEQIELRVNDTIDAAYNVCEDCDWDDEDDTWTDEDVDEAYFDENEDDPYEDEELDEESDHDARELHLYASNHADLHRQRMTPIHKNLRNKQAAGTYDSDKAHKAFGHAAKDAADRYHKEHGHRFSKATRDKVAAKMRDEFERDSAAGEHDHLLHKKHQKKKNESVEHLDEMRPHGMNLSVGSIQDTPSMKRYYAKLAKEREERAAKAGKPLPKPSDDLKGGKRPEKKLESVEHLDELKAGTYYKAHQRAHQEKISADDEAAMGTPGAAEDSKKRARQMKKFMKAAASRSEDGKTRKEEVEHLDEKKKDKKAKKDHDGDGKIETGTQEWRGSVDKAIKKAIASRGGN